MFMIICPMFGGLVPCGLCAWLLFAVGGLLPFFAFMGLWVLKKYRRRGPPRLNLIPSSDHNSFFKVKALRKKKPRERSEQGRFFFSKPEGAALPENELFRPLLGFRQRGILYHLMLT